MHLHLVVIQCLSHALVGLVMNLFFFVLYLGSFTLSFFSLHGFVAGWYTLHSDIIAMQCVSFFLLLNSILSGVLASLWLCYRLVHSGFWISWHPSLDILRVMHWTDWLRAFVPFCSSLVRFPLYLPLSLVYCSLLSNLFGFSCYPTYDSLRVMHWVDCL